MKIMGVAAGLGVILILVAGSVFWKGNNASKPAAAIPVEKAAEKPSSGSVVHAPIVLPSHENKAEKAIAPRAGDKMQAPVEPASVNNASEHARVPEAGSVPAYLSEPEEAVTASAPIPSPFPIKGGGQQATQALPVFRGVQNDSGPSQVVQVAAAEAPSLPQFPVETNKYGPPGGASSQKQLPSFMPVSNKTGPVSQPAP